MRLKKREGVDYKKKVLLGIFAFALIFMSIGYSYIGTFLDIGLSLKLKRMNDSSVEVEVLGKKMTAYKDNEMSPNVSSLLGIDYLSENSDTNGRGLYLKAETANSENPIIFYRGNVNDNNVLFANFCWKIVRTTEYGGTKLLYNGVPTSDGVCNNTGENSLIGKSQFNDFTNYGSVGYMYNSKTNNYETNVNESLFITNTYDVLDTLSTNNYNYYFSKSYTTSGLIFKKAKLSSPKTFSSWDDAYRELGNGGYYTCKSTSASDTCGIVYYVVGADENAAYTLSVSVGKTLEEADTDIVFGTSVDTRDDNLVLSGDIKTIRKSEFYKRYNEVKGMYTCNDDDGICSSALSVYVHDSSPISFIGEWVVNEYFGNDVEWDGSQYILKDVYIKPCTLSITLVDKDNDIGNRHYMCSSGTTCKTVFFITSSSPHTQTSDGLTSKSAYGIKFSNGYKIDDIYDKELSSDSVENNDIINKNNSTIKQFIDEWYGNNLLEYTSYLEDSVWCNDRTIYKSGKFNKDSKFFSSVVFDYKAYKLNTNIKNPFSRSVSSCEYISDKFTVSNTDGNGKLTYPVGLITFDEEMLAGDGEDSFLNAHVSYWSLSPYSNGAIDLVSGSTMSSNSSSGVRPSITLKKGVLIYDGDGTTSNPYRLE